MLVASLAVAKRLKNHDGQEVLKKHVSLQGDAGELNGYRKVLKDDGEAIESELEALKVKSQRGGAKGQWGGGGGDKKRQNP